VSAKESFIDEYFKRWDKDVAKAAELLKTPQYHLEAILVLSCYLGAFAAMRFPTLKDGEAYVKVILEYSGKRDFFEQIDLLFFYQWPRSKLRDNGNYKGLKNHSDLVKTLTVVFKSEDDIKAGIRYVVPAKIVEPVLAAGIKGFDEANFREKLPLFSLAELLYRYLRCDAVHSADFPFINEVSDGKGNIRYENNHAITGEVVLETVQGVMKALWKECLDKKKWPHQL
jgi:hypothetical protein